MYKHFSLHFSLVHPFVTVTKLHSSLPLPKLSQHNWWCWWSCLQQGSNSHLITLFPLFLQPLFSRICKLKYFLSRVCRHFVAFHGSAWWSCARGELPQSADWCGCNLGVSAKLKREILAGDGKWVAHYLSTLLSPFLMATSVDTTSPLLTIVLISNSPENSHNSRFRLPSSPSF